MNNDSNTFYKDTLYSTIKLGIVCPMANERKTAESFVCDVLEKCRKFNFKSVSFFVILDNASKDGTIDIMRNLSKQVYELNVVFAPENQCVVDAYILNELYAGRYSNGKVSSHHVVFWLLNGHQTPLFKAICLSSLKFWGSGKIKR